MRPFWQDARKGVLAKFEVEFPSEEAIELLETTGSLDLEQTHMPTRWIYQQICYCDRLSPKHPHLV